MNSNDGKNIGPPDANGINEGSCAQGSNAAPIQNSKNSTIKINSLSIKLGFVKEKGDAEKCSHFSIRGYVAGMRERGSSNFLPFAQELPPMDVKQFRYWLCQSCVRNYGTANTSHETKLVSACDHSMILRGTTPCPPQACAEVAVTVLPFGEGTSGVKPVDHMNNDDHDADANILPVLGADENQSSQEICANDRVSQEPTTLICYSDTNLVAEENSTPARKDSNELSDEEDPLVKDTINSVVGPPIQSCQQNDYPNGHPRRKARKVRLLKELLCGNTKIQKQKKEISASLGPKPSPPLPPSQIKRKILHDHEHEHEHDLDIDQDQNQNQRSIDIPTPAKKAKTFKGITAAKPTMVEHSRDPKSGEALQNDNKYLWNKHGTQRSSNFGKVSSDPVTAWRSIFSDMGKTDNQVASKDRGTEPYSNLMAPPHPDKKFKKISRNPLKSKFFSEDSRRTNVGGGGVGGSRPKDGRSETELGLGLSLNYDPQAQIRSQPSILNRPPIQDHNSRKPGFFLGESSVSHRIPSDSRSKQGLVHDVSNMHPPRPVLLQEQQRPYPQLSYGNCSVHQKLDFTDPHKRNTGFRGYSDVMRPLNHQRQGKIGRSDEREIVELMAKNQYERNLCEARISQPSSWQPPSHHEYQHRPPGNFFYQDQVSDYNMFNTFPQSRNQSSNAMWTSDLGTQRHNYHHKGNNNTRYTSANMQVLEALNNYQNGNGNGNGNGRQYNQTSRDLFSNFPGYGDGFARFSEKDKEKSMMDLDLNVVAPIVTEEHNNFESLDMNPKNIRSSYPNETIPAMQLLSLMDSGKSNHPSKTLSPCYIHKTKPIPNPNPNSHLRPTGNSRNFGLSSFQTDQNGMLQSSYGNKPQEEKSSYEFPLQWRATEDRGSKMNPSETKICTTNENPADFSTPGPENLYMVDVEHLVFRSAAAAEKRQKRPM